MKNDFLLIPDAPAYEINSELCVRNVKTGRFLKPWCHCYTKKFYVRLTVTPDGRTLSRQPRELRRQAVMSIGKGNFFLPIPSTNGRYEINPRGILRNVRTRRIIKSNSHNMVTLYPLR